MNIIRMTGGLGNQMFQYALYLRFLKDNKECFMEDWSEYEGRDNARPILLKDAFGIDYKVSSKEDYNRITDSYMDLPHRVLRKIRGRRNNEYCEATCDYDENLLNQDEAYITGYFQTAKYFETIEDDIRKAFTFTDEVKKQASELLGDFKIDENTVSIHIRRGDYVSASDIYGNICTDSYYEAAINYLKRNSNNKELNFLLFSNDYEWTKNWAIAKLSGEKYHIFCGTDESNGYIDMYLMSKCAHNIIANSSFSWWASYLNNNESKIVIAPDKWVNNEERNDIYESYMLRFKGEIINEIAR